MNDTVASFYAKDSYQESYDSQHGARLDAVVAHHDLKNRLAGKRVVDIGGGMGFLGKRLDPSTDYCVIDGAEIAEKDRLCAGNWKQFDLDHDQFGSYRDTSLCGPFDAALCLETLEHLPGIYHCVEQMKRLVKRDGDIYISVPTETVWHNVIYPSLLWPPQNFHQWLGQMALPVVEFWTYKPKDRGWPAYQYHCRNADWTESVMLFKKDDLKFYGQTPVGYANL